MPWITAATDDQRFLTMALATKPGDNDDDDDEDDDDDVANNNGDDNDYDSTSAPKHCSLDVNV